MRALLQEARENHLDEVSLEVIAGNDPAQALFEKYGFVPSRKLLVLHRAAGPLEDGPGQITWLKYKDAMDLIKSSPAAFAWTNQGETFQHQDDAEALKLVSSGQEGWLVFRHSSENLSHLIFHTMAGDPDQVGYALTAHLYQRYPEAETWIENIEENDHHLGGLFRAGFRRGVSQSRDAVIFSESLRRCMYR